MELKSISPSQLLHLLPSYPPGLSLLHGSALGLDGVVDDATGPSREVHGDEGVLRYTPLLKDVAGWAGRVRVGVGSGGGKEHKEVGEGEGGKEGSKLKQARHTHWGMTNPVCTQTHFSQVPS